MTNLADRLLDMSFQSFDRNILIDYGHYEKIPSYRSRVCSGLELEVNSTLAYAALAVNKKELLPTQLEVMSGTKLR